MAFKVGRENNVLIANVKTRKEEKKMAQFDVNKDNRLDAAEQAKYYADKTGGKTPASIDDVYKVAGGRQHPVKRFDQDYYQTIYTYAPNAKGDFSVAGAGAGNIHTGRTQVAYDAKGKPTVEAYNFLVNCDLMDRNFFENNISKATIVIGPSSFPKEGTSKVAEEVEIPMNLATADGYQAYNRGGGSYWVPEKKYLTSSVDVKDLKKLMGTKNGLSFYVRLETNDGKTLFINKDGKAFKNFEIDASELKPMGTP